jgi:endonuclease V-like protein UPF0215 family
MVAALSNGDGERSGLMKKAALYLVLGMAVFLCLAVAIGAIADGSTVYLPIVLRRWGNVMPPAATATPTVTATPYPGVVLITLGDPITVQGPGAVISGTTVTIVAGGTYRVIGTLANGMVDVNTTAEVEMILDGVAITHTTGPAINVTNAAKVSVVLADGVTNTLIDGATYSDSNQKGTLCSSGTLEISGNGALVITGKYKHAIASNDLIIRGGNITTVSTVKDGFHAYHSITVHGGTIHVSHALSDGFESEGDLLVDGGTMTLAVAERGLKSADTITINGGNIQISSATEGIEGKTNLIVNDATIEITSSDNGLNATNDITINGGRIYLNSATDGIDSNGTMHINGGVIVALGLSPESGLDCGANTVTFTGGIVVATGGTNSTPANTSTQHVVVLGSTAVGSVIHMELDGADVLTFRVSKAYDSMIFTSPALLGHRSYTAYTGGSVTGGTDFHGLYTGATYSGGSVWVTFTTDEMVTYAGGTTTATATPTVTALPAGTATPTATATPYAGVVRITLGDPITVQGPGAVVSGTTVSIIAGGAYSATGTLTDGMIAVQTTDEVELILDGVAITHAQGPAINVINAKKLSLVLADGVTNTLTDGPTYSDTSAKGTLFSRGTLEISGNGALVVTGNYKHGIVSDDALIIRSGNITIVGTVKDGFHASDITVYDGTIHIISAGNDGFESEGGLVVEGGMFMLSTVDQALISHDTLTINGGLIDIETSDEGIESKKNLIINGGAFTIAAARNGLNAMEDITINGGRIYLNTAGDAIDSNGTLHINDGVIVGLGGDTPESGLDCDFGPMTLNGGILVATGSDNTIPSDESAQRIVMLGGTDVGSVIHIVQEDGTEALTFQVTKAYQSMIFTSPALEANKPYTAYTGGTLSGGSDFHGLYSGATYSGGAVWVTFTTDAVVTYVGGAPPWAHGPRDQGKPVWRAVSRAN